MLTTEHLEALATVHLHPQTQAGGEIDITALLRAVEAAAATAERERCANVAESWSDYYNSVASIGPRIARAIRGPNVEANRPKTAQENP